MRDAGHRIKFKWINIFIIVKVRLEWTLLNSTMLKNAFVSRIYL